MVALERHEELLRKCIAVMDFREWRGTLKQINSLQGLEKQSIDVANGNIVVEMAKELSQDFNEDGTPEI